MTILLAGLNHTTAPIEVRERLAFSDVEVEAALPALRDLLGAREVFLLSTCNRTELLAVFQAESQFAAPDLITFLCRLKPGATPPPADAVYEHRGDAAIAHLYRVAAGLDSMVLGEPQILGQVRQAYALAARVGTSGLHVNRILHGAFRVGKRARAETDLGFGSVSVGSVAVMLACKVFGHIKEHAALVIGAGEMAQAAALHLREQGIRHLIFVNRTQEKAEELAARYEGEALPFDDLYRAMERADIVVSSTGAPGVILTHEMFHKVMAKRHTRPIFLVDIAVPRDIDPEIREHENAFLYDIDSLRVVVDRNLQRRRDAVPEAEAMVREELESHRRWQANLVVKPVVKLLHEHFESTRKCEVIKAVKTMAQGEAEEVDRVTRLILSKLLHGPTEVLKDYDPESEEGQRALAIVCKLFDLK